MANEQNVSRQDGKTPWKLHDYGVGERTALAGLRFLKNLCDAYDVALTGRKDEYERDKKELYAENRSNLEFIGKRESEAVAMAEQKSTSTHASIYNIDNEKTARGDALNEYLKNSSAKAGPLRNLAQKMASGAKEADLAFSRVEVAKKAVDEALLAYRTQQSRLRNESVKRANAAAEVERAKESARYGEATEKLQEKYKADISEMDSQYRGKLNASMSDKDIRAYQKMVSAYSPVAENFTCATTIPEYVRLGDVAMEIGRKSELNPEVAQMFTDGANSALETGTPGVISASLPYCQRLEDGISLFVNYSPRERAQYREHLRMMLLKLFMAFPAGKLEATMIDPLELGETFAMFTKLGEEQSRIIDTKVWSQEKDISEAINVLRQKLETMTQSYGEDKETRLKKESVRVLAITDFPTGFTQDALRDLQAIVRKSASYGVCVFIWANSEEIAKLQLSQQSIFNEIKQMLHVATAERGVLLLKTDRDEQIRLKLDNAEQLKEHASSIIDALTKGIHSSRRKIERFEDMFNGIEDPNNWFAENTISELAIPIGIKGANTIVRMIVGKTDGSTAHHALIAGQTGAGKSTLLHTIIMSTLLNYSPDEAQLYLVDFKEGVEFKTYSKLNLPAVKVVAIDCEREFGLNILKELEKEMKRRYDLFKREADREEISDYRKITGKKIPKILVVFDEVQELFRGPDQDSISKECESLLGELLTLGRAAGIHIILASQNFNLISSIKPTLFAHSAIRIAIKGSEDSASSVLGDNNPGAKQLQDGATGAAVYNDASGKESANAIFQVGYLDKEKRAEYLSKLSALQNSEAFARKYKEKTRVLLTNAEDDIFNVFNQLILNKEIEPRGSDGEKYGLIVGDGFEFSRKFKIDVSPGSRQNLLAIGSDEKKAASLFYFSILSLLYDELGNKDAKKNNQLVHLIDLSVEDEYIEPSDTNFKHLESLFPNQVKRVGMRDMEEMISVTYDTLRRRMDGAESTAERLFFMFFGISRAHRLINGSMYDDGDSGEMTTLSKLHEIIKHGSQYGINCIVWGENLASADRLIGANGERDFAQRIVFSSDPATMEQLVMEHGSAALRPTTAVYMNVEEDIKNTHFRVYDIPAKVWVDKIAKTYREFV